MRCPVSTAHASRAAALLVNCKYGRSRYQPEPSQTTGKLKQQQKPQELNVSYRIYYSEIAQIRNFAERLRVIMVSDGLLFTLSDGYAAARGRAGVRAVA